MIVIFLNKPFIGDHFTALFDFNAGDRFVVIEEFIDIGIVETSEDGF